MLCTVILTLTNTTTSTWSLLLDYHWYMCVYRYNLYVRSKLIILVWFKMRLFLLYTLHALSAFSLVKSLQLILKIKATYRSVSYLREANWLTCRSCAQCMIHDFQEWCQTVFHATVCLSLFPSKQVYKYETIILDSVLVIFKVLNIVLSLGW